MKNPSSSPQVVLRHLYVGVLVLLIRIPQFGVCIRVPVVPSSVQKHLASQEDSSSKQRCRKYMEPNWFKGFYTTVFSESLRREMLQRDDLGFRASVSRIAQGVQLWLCRVSIQVPLILVSLRIRLRVPFRLPARLPRRVPSRVPVRVPRRVPRTVSERVRAGLRNWTSVGLRFDYSQA